MAGGPLEFFLMLGYAVILAFVAFLLECAARHVHRRSLGASTVGFTYHADRDVWRCPRDQHLFPVFSDPAKGIVIYRAPAAVCNACRSKAACTDSNNGREIERRDAVGLEHGMKRFHRAMSLTLLVLAILVLVVEFFRASGLYPRLVLVSALILYSLVAKRMTSDLIGSAREDAALSSVAPAEAQLESKGKV